MPRYNVNGTVYNIPEEKVEGFERRYPDAVVEYENGGRVYAIPLSRREGFLRKYPEAVAVGETRAESEESDNRSVAEPTLLRGSDNPSVADPSITNPSVSSTQKQGSSSNRGAVSVDSSGDFNSSGKVAEVRRLRAQADHRLSSDADRANAVLRNMQEYNSHLGMGHSVESGLSAGAEKEYLTPTGLRTTNKAVADIESFNFRQAADMSVGGQLLRARGRLADIDERLEERGRVLLEEHERNKAKGFAGFLTEMGEIIAGDRMGGNRGRTPEDEVEFQTDNEYQALRLAKRQLEEQIQQLENYSEKESEGERFWHDYGRNTWQKIADVDAWDFGKNSLRDAATRLQIANRAERGEELTDAENEALYEMYMHNNVMSEFGDLGKGAKWGDITGGSLTFMKDFLITGGFSGISTKLATKLPTQIAAKAATRMGLNATESLGVKLAQDGLYATVRQGGKGVVARLLAEQGKLGTATIVTTKALGVTAEDLLVRAPLMVGTVQGQSTAAEIINTKLGPVAVDKETGGLHFVDDTSWGEAAWEVGADKVIENFSEMWGAHLPGMSDVTRVFGARNLTAALLRSTRPGAGTVLSKTSEFLGKAGVNGYLGEVGEEYYGQLWRTGLGLDSAKDADGNNLFMSGEFHGDIWGGMALSIGMMSGGTMAVNYAGKGIDKGLNSARYLHLKHMVNKSDRKASEAFTPEVWEGMRMLYDSADNADMCALATQVMNDKEMSDEQRKAAMEYMERSMIMRGYNLREYVERRNAPSEEDDELSQCYIDGYNINTAQEMNDAKNQVEYQWSRVVEALGEEAAANIERSVLAGHLTPWTQTPTRLRGSDNPSVANPLGTDPYPASPDSPYQSRGRVHSPIWETGEELKTLSKQGSSSEVNNVVRDYLNAKMVYDGMMQRVRDDIDGRIDQSNAMVDARTNRTTGMIQPATMKQDDRRVYVVNGNLVQYEDGSGIDNNASDGSIIIRDAETGTLEQVSPESILNIDTPLNPYDEKETAAEAIRQQYAQEAANKIDGVVTFNGGEVYRIKVESGESDNAMGARHYQGTDPDPASPDIRPLSHFVTAPLSKQGSSSNRGGIENPIKQGGSSVADGFIEVRVVANEQGIVDNGDGTVNVSDGVNIFPIAKETIQQQVEEANLARLAQFEQARAAENAAIEAANRPQYAFNDNVTLRDDEGNIIHGQIAEHDEADDTFVLDVDSPIGGKYAPMLTRGELESMITEHNGKRIAPIGKTDRLDSTNEYNIVSLQKEGEERYEQRKVDDIFRERDAIATLTEAGNAGTGSRTTTQIGRSGGSKESLLGNVVRTSKRNKTWIEDVREIAGVQIGFGQENEVYLSKDSKSVIKVNSFEYLSEDSEDFTDFINRIETHNELFPDVPLTILGYTENSDGKVSVVMSQPYIEAEREATDAEIDAFLEDMGFYTDMSGDWTNGNIVIADVKPANVLIDKNGKLAFIDALVYDDRKGGKMMRIPPRSTKSDEKIPQSAMERVPKDEQGNPLYEQADTDTAWDAIVEQTEGDEVMAQTVADGMVADKEAALKKIEKAKAKGGVSIAEKIAAEKERKAAIDAAKQELDIWKKIAGTANRRKAERLGAQKRIAAEAAARLKAEEAERLGARLEAERIEREALNGVPDMVDDTPQDARARGYRRVSGHKIDRQEPIPGLQGKEIAVKFSDNTIPTGRVAVIEAEQLQPSHIGGQRNPLHFIDEAQPKERNDEASVLSARKIAGNIRPEEITSSVTAYTGAPTVNARGEAIQGNSRSDALRQMWESHPEQSAKYKQYLTDHAQEFGLNAEDIAGMQHPVLVNMLDVEDADAITLGQYVAQDTESGGTERIKPKNALQRMGTDIRTFANLLLKSTDEETSFAGLVDNNGATVLEWMSQRGFITPTQYKSAFDSKGNLTAEAKNDLRGIMYQSIFKGGSTRLEEMFNAMPAKAQKAILATAFRDYDSPSAERVIEEIQNSIRAYYALSQDAAFVEAKTFKEARMAAEGWKIQYQIDDATGDSYLPAENFSNFALLLATMYKGEKQSIIQGTFNKLYDLIQGTQEENLFEQPDNTPRTLAQAIKETLNIIYNGQRRSNVLVGDSSASQRGQQGSTGNAATGERVEDGERTADSAGRTDGDSRGSRIEGENRGNQGEETETPQDVTVHLTAGEAQDFIADMELSADVAPEIDLTIENWDALFGESGTVNTPIGEVKMGENQFAKLMRQGREGKLGMIKPTLENPHAIVEEASEAKEGDTTERASSYIFIRSFKKADGSRFYYFTSITVSKDGKEVVVSSQEKSRNKILRLLQEGNVIWRTPKDTTTSSAERQGLDYEQPNKAETAAKGSGITPQSTPSDSKDTTNPPTTNELDEKNGREARHPSVGEQVQAAEAEVNTNPTDKQKEAGNYKKGHVQIRFARTASARQSTSELGNLPSLTHGFGTFNVTIEQPKGSVRSGVDKGGKKWEIEMQNTYGYIRGTEGVDGDHIDVFLSDDIDGWNGRQVYVVDQRNEDGSFDEHKVMLGFNDINDAEAAYLSNYEKGWHGLGAITGVAIEDFEKWIASSHRKTKAFAEYKTVKTTEGQSAEAKYGKYQQFHDEFIEGLNERKFIPNISQIRTNISQLKKKIKALENGMAMGVSSDEEFAKAQAAIDDATNHLNAFKDILDTINKKMEEAERQAAIDGHQTNNTPTLSQKSDQVSDQVSDAPYSIAPAQYTTKKGKVLDMHLVKFGSTLTKEQQRAAKELAKADKGWYDSKQGGFMMRSEESAKQLAETIISNEEAVSDAQPISLADTRKVVERLDTQTNQGNRLVSDERYAELRERMRKKLGGQMNIGIDPEILAIGTEMAVYHLEKGARKFTEYAKVMISDLGDVIRPYLKAFYNGARELPEVVENGLASDMTSYDEVQSFDVANFDKQGIDAFATAETVTREAEVAQEVEVAQERIKKTRSAKKETKKKSVTSQEQTGGLFDDLFAETNKTDAELHRQFAMTVKADMLAALDNGTKPYRSILDLRKRASELGMEVDNDGRTDILLQELVEDGLVRAAREVIGRKGRNSRASYDLICKLYEMQPTIAARSSNRIKMQQYSTPLPMAWIANRFAMANKADCKVLEPTAGNGMLVFTVPVEQVHANELDETRLENLREQGFAKVTQQDATEPFEGGMQYDVIIANPPFGKREAVEYDGKMIPGLDPQITLNALASMKDDGRAAIIIGGNMEYASNGAIKSMKPFFTYLYDHYNVKGVIDMSGGLYAKQGTTFPTRMILIDGRRSDEERAQTAVYPPVESKAIRKAESFDDLYEIINEVLNSKEKTNGTEILHSRERQLASVNNEASGNTDGARHREQPRKNDDVGSRGNRTERNSGRGEQVLPRERRTNNADGETRTETPRNNAGGSRSVSDTNIQRVGTERVSTSGVGLTQTPTEHKKRTLTDEKSAYRPHNSAFSLNSVAPAAMVEAMDNVLTQIEAQHGSIDEFIRTELGYDTIEEAHQALAAEQMDSVAMAIYQMKQGQALIIGDQTGVGKGRQMAALIRWAVQRGEKPVFITQKADLFSDIYRDLVDVGSGDLVPFIFNSDGAMVDSKGNTVHKPLSSAKMAKVFASGTLPDEYDFAVLTYSQVNTGDAVSQQEMEEAAKKSGARTKKSKNVKNGRATPKATFLRAIAEDNYLFLDESHTAAGSSNTGAYLQSILRTAKAATFASATFAKRPDTMPLYAIRTAMSQAKVEPDKMISIIEKGGVTLQEIMSRELTNAGQMVRRERDMSDVVTDWKTITDPQTVRRARENYDRTIAAFNAIIKFQEDYVKPMIEALDMELAVMAESAGVKRGTDKMGVENVPFASKTYNYTKQLMLALKVDAIADEVEAEINAGRHPVIALESTMESSIKDYAAGEIIDEPTFSASLLKGLDTIMQYTVKDENGNERHERYSPQALGPAGEKAYYELQDFIRESTSDIFISPLDAIIERLHEKGYKVGELTGRNMYVERNEDGRVVVKRRTDKDKKRMQREFNSGVLDVLILNKSASTGISLHASEKFSDQRQRSMIIAQPLSDINDYMQMIGRIDRTGQVHRGYYINLGLPVPAENRFLMMLSTKLKSLNANTTTSQDSESNDVEAPDLLNKYGSQVVVEYLRDNVEIYEKMGTPLKKGGLGGGRVQASELDEYKPQEDDARKVTGYVALLTTKEQEEFYDDVVRRYNELIKYLNDTGSNDLKINVMPLRAKTIEKRVSSEGIDPNGSNPFARNSFVEKVEMDVLRKPMKADEIRKVIEQINRGIAPAEYLGSVIETIRKEDEARIAAEEERYEKAKAKAVEDIAKQTDKINGQKKRSEEEKRVAIENFIAETNEKVEAKHNDNILRLNQSSDQIMHRLRMFEVGKSYLVPDNLESMIFDFATPAIFCGYKTKDSKITASTTLAVFATLDGRRRIEIKLSQIDALRSIDKMTNDNWDAARATTLDNWDSQIPSETRKTGFIMTGNILQAIADTQDEYGGYPGQLISYTDIDGNVHDGILMPDKWNASMLKTSGAPLSSRLPQIKDYAPITSHDGKVEIMGSSWAKMFYLTVPKTKKDGAVYYENKTLLRAAGGNFYPYRGKLRADIPEDRITEVVKELTKLGVKVKEERTDDDTLYRSDDAIKNRIEALFNQAISGEFKGKPISIGRLTDAGKAYLEQISGVAFRENVDFVLNPSDLMHIYKDHFGNNEKDKGQNIPLDIEDIRSLADVISNPDKVIFFKEGEGSNRNMFYFFKEAEDGTYNLMEIYSDRKGNLTAKTFYKTRKDATQRVMDIEKSLLPTSETYSGAILSDAKIPQMFESASIEDEFYVREGEGTYTDDEVSQENDPISKVMGKSIRSGRQRKEFAERERKRMAERVETLAKKLHLDNVEIVTDASTLEGKKQRAKGFYSKSTGKITIVIPNHTSAFDVEQTLLHEAVAHYGLRQLFGEHFDTFLDNVFNNADESIGKRIVALRKRLYRKYVENAIEGVASVFEQAEIIANLPKSETDFTRTATEEYLASLAERTNFEQLEHSWSWWQSLKRLFMDMLEKIGFEGFTGVTLSDNELRYLLWRSYENLAEPGRHRSILGEAADVAMQYDLKVGNYADESNGSNWSNMVADGNIDSNEARERSENAIIAEEAFKSNFNSAPILLVTKENELASCGKILGFSDEEIPEFVEYASNPDREAAYDPVSKKIIIFAYRSRSPYIAMFHENVHHAINELTGNADFSAEWATIVKELKECRPKTYKRVQQEYDSEEVDEELICYSLERAFQRGRINSLREKLSARAQQELDRILNYIGYDEQRDTAEGVGRYEYEQYSGVGRSGHDRSGIGFSVGVGHQANARGTEDARITTPDSGGTPGETARGGTKRGIERDKTSEADPYPASPEVLTPQSQPLPGFAGLPNPSGTSATSPIFLRKTEEELKTLSKQGESAVALSKVNERFNAELEELTEENAQSVILNLGYPNNLLIRAGVSNKPIRLYGNKVIKKMKKHGFALSEIRNLPNAINNPVAVFNNYKTESNRAVLTELHTSQGNILVTISWGKGTDAELNIVSSVFGKNKDNIVDWINKGYATYINKEKALKYLRISAPIAEAQDKQELITATKIVKDFENPKVEEELLFRDGDPEIHERELARHRYERRVKSGMFQSREALQDSMLGLKEAMQAILGKGKQIEDVDGFENAYLGENRLSSVNKAEADAFARLLFKPMLDEVAKLARNEAERLELTDYMMAKHGLERNEYMRQQAEANGEDADRDFAGLTALTGMDNVADAEAEAQQMVTDYEDAHDTTDLWEKVNAVSKAILQKSYECGMMSKETFDKVSGMYEYYIPLRGFDEKTSAEAYAYLSHKQSAFNAPIKKAEGRSSKADDPFANLQSMAEGAIMQGNRNKLVKQRFLNFVLNHPSDLVSVSDIWVEYDAVTDEWKPVFPDNIDSTDTPDEVEQKMQDFETKMEGLAQQYPDRYKHGKDAIGIPYRIVESRDMRQHQIVVKRGGRDYILTINGNPRAAQALNGQTNPDNDMSGAIGALLRAGEKINRQLSAFYTTRNPDFIVSNFMRDMLYTNTMAWIKESPNYALRFHRNYVMVNPVKLKHLLAKHRNGTLDMSNKTEAMFHQFMMNGGETGYANIRDIEQHKNDIRKELKKANGKLKIGRAMSLLAERFDELNRAVENCARFAAFVTSREMGRSIDRSIYDAKEISVNFNKKGSGAKFYDSVGQTRAGNAGALISGLGRSGYVFWNAAIQGTTNFGRQMKRHPAKAFTGVAAMFLLGAIVAYLGGDDDDDDKNAYYNLPEYVRRSNILFRAGDSWISIPLPIEYRSFYGMGELMTSIFNGKEHLTGGEIAEAIAGQATQMLPIDFLEGGGGLNAFVPSAAKPLWEAYVAEKSWTGMPLYKDTPYNKDMPEWTKVYKSANKHIVGLAAALNEATGGDPYTKGGIDFNPAKVEYLLNGYFGGVFSTIDKMTKTAETIAGAREYDPRSVLIVNRLVKAGDERTEYRAVNNEYFRLKEEHDRLKTRLKHYEEDTDNGIFDYAEKIDFLYNSPEYERYEIFEDYRKDIDDLYEELKEAVDNEERKDIEAELNELKKEMISEMEYTRKRK